jgi:hypothetical protein
MAKCGIDKYDALPARVGFVDVDYLRWRLSVCLNPSSNPIIKFFSPAHTESDKKQIMKLLDSVI